MTSPTRYILFLKKCLQLKQTIRTGWKLRNVNRPESTADHSYQMALMAITWPNLPVDVKVLGCFKNLRV